MPRRPHSPRKHRKQRRPPSVAVAHPTLPPVCFGRLTGTCERISAASRYRNVPDDNHIYLWLRIAAGQLAGSFECAVNLAAPLRWGGFSPLLVCERQDECTLAELPAEGFDSRAKCSYAGMGLRDADFTERAQMLLAESITTAAKSCLRVAAFGVTYGNGEGLHDIHLNSHETPLSRHRNRLDEHGQPTQDGALVFYYLTENPKTLRRHWLFTKFVTQRLG